MKPKKLSGERLELAAKYLAMDNLATLDVQRIKIVDMKTLERAVHAAWEIAVVGYMESQEGGYDDRHESEAVHAVEAEIKSFRSDLKAGGKRAKYWIETLQKEIPFLFLPEPENTNTYVISKGASR